jgi:hemerythrin-like metal-binding protein
MRDRCIQHFATEDKVLRATQFPDRDRHLRSHRRILTEINGILVDLESVTTPNRLHWELALSLRGILIDHLLRDDLKYKSHLMYYEAPRA